jgi:hypothetical protein
MPSGYEKATDKSEKNSTGELSEQFGQLGEKYFDYSPSYDG